MPWMNMTCGFCGHEADIEEFGRTPVGGELPRGHWQCPACQRGFRVSAGPGTRYPSGLYVPGPVRLVPVPSKL